MIPRMEPSSAQRAALLLLQLSLAGSRLDEQMEQEAERAHYTALGEDYVAKPEDTDKTWLDQPSSPSHNRDYNMKPK